MEYRVTMTVPSTMRCIEIKAPGGPEQLVLAERPVPQPKAGEVLIAVGAAGVNRADVLQRLGNYPAPPGASDILGLEVAGTVVAHGPKDDNTKMPAIGTKVCTILAGGGYAEYAVAPAGSCMPIPANLSVIEGAALAETYCTVWHNVFQRGALKSGEVLLVHGGSSGIGTTAIQLGKAFGAYVAVTAGSDDKCDACLKLGADLAVNYRRSDFVEIVAAKAPGGGADVILDMVGAGYVARNIACLKPDGRMVNIAYLEGSKVEVNLMPVMLKRLTMTGSTLRARDNGFKAALADVLQERVWPMLLSGAIKPIMDKVFPLAQAAEAHRRMESSQHIGKIVLETGLNP
jgi:NADPH2:quinone reductase